MGVGRPGNRRAELTGSLFDRRWEPGRIDYQRRAVETDEVGAVTQSFVHELMYLHPNLLK